MVIERLVTSSIATRVLIKGGSKFTRHDLKTGKAAQFYKKGVAITSLRTKQAKRYKIEGEETDIKFLLAPIRKAKP